MDGLSLPCQVDVPTNIDPTSYSVTLLRSFRPHPSPFKNLSDLQTLRSFNLDKNGRCVLELQKSEVTSLLAGRHKTLYIVVAVVRLGVPLHISGAYLLAKLQDQNTYRVELTDADIADNAFPDTDNTPTIPTDTNSDVKDEVIVPDDTVTELMSQRLERDFDLESTEKLALQQRLSPKLKKRRAQRQKRKAFVKSKIATDMARKRRKGVKFIPKEKINDELIEASIKSSADRLENVQMRGSTVYLDENDLKDLGVNERVPEVALNEDQQQALEQRHDIDTPEIKRQAMPDPCQPIHVREQLSAHTEKDLTKAVAATTTDEQSGGSTDNNNVGLQSLYEALQASLLAQVQTSEAPNLNDIDQSLQQDIAAGPADTTAYYDYHSLNFAWESIWTSVFDQRSEREISALYDQVVEIVGPEIADELESSDAEDLADFLTELSDVARDASGQPGVHPPPILLEWIPELADRWAVLTQAERSRLLKLRMSASKFRPKQLAANRKLAMGILSAANGRSVETPNIGRLQGLIEGIHHRLNKEPYSFDVFVPDSYNFGIMQTYQQKWRPLNYQPGDLISTMPLAPGETKKYSTKTVLKENRKRSVSDTQRITDTSERNLNTKSQSDVIAKASYNASTTSSLSSKFSGNILAFKADGTVSGSVTAGTTGETQKNKQEIRDNTLKAAQEYKDERSIEVVSTLDSTSEYSSTSEISNPNNEITVTYLFYELQRRYEVSTRLDKIEPVVMVAFDVPAPSDIDEDWLLTHDWILRESLLDAKLVSALDYLREGFTGDEVTVSMYRTQWESQMRVVDEIRDNVSMHMKSRDAVRDERQDTAEAVADKPGFFRSIYYGLGGQRKSSSDVTDENAFVSKDELEAARESARLAMEWANSDLQTANAKLQSAVNALERATNALVNAVRDRQKMRTQIDQLRIHVKENILYYMQAIWAKEPPDQRYFRLYDLEVIWPDRTGNAILSKATNNTKKDQLLDKLSYGDQTAFNGLSKYELKYPAPQVNSNQKRPLHEVADVDNLLGFKGNYAIFKLRDDNAITKFMSQSFLDSHFGLFDPDLDANLPTRSEALDIAKCRWLQADAHRDDKQSIVDWLIAVWDKHDAIADNVVLPTGQLFVEALPGAHPLLEEFKLKHRAVDLLQANQNLKLSQIDGLRHMKRLIDGDTEDPNVDKLIKVDGSSTDVTVSDN